MIEPYPRPLIAVSQHQPNKSKTIHFRLSPSGLVARCGAAASACGDAPATRGAGPRSSVPGPRDGAVALRGAADAASGAAPPSAAAACLVPRQRVSCMQVWGRVGGLCV